MAKRDDAGWGRSSIWTNRATRELPEMVASWARMGSGHSEDSDIGFHIAQDHPESCQCTTGSEADTSPIGDMNPVGWYAGCTPLVGGCKDRHTHFVGRD